MNDVREEKAARLGRGLVYRLDAWQHRLVSCLNFALGWGSGPRLNALLSADAPFKFYETALLKQFIQSVHQSELVVLEAKINHILWQTLFFELSFRL